MKREKKNFILAGIFVVALMIVWVAMDPHKVTDPNSPQFNPDRFQFSDYKGRQELINVYKILFPMGTPKSFVDRVLVDAGGAVCGPLKNVPNEWYCRQPKTLKHWDVGPHFSIRYDEQMRLLNINPNGLGEIYSERKAKIN